MKKLYVYILQSISSNKYYVGQTNDLERRLFYHNSGYSKSTKSGIPWKLNYKEEFLTRAEEMKREKQIKSYKNKSYLGKIIDNL